MQAVSSRVNLRRKPHNATASRSAQSAMPALSGAHIAPHRPPHSRRATPAPRGPPWRGMSLQATLGAQRRQQFVADQRGLLMPRRLGVVTVEARGEEGRRSTHARAGRRCVGGAGGGRRGWSRDLLWLRPAGRRLTWQLASDTVIARSGPRA